MQTRDCEQVKGTGLLKWFLDVFGRLMSQSKRDATEKILHLRRIVQATADHALQPGAGFLRSSQNRIARSFAKASPIFSVTNEQTSSHILAREIPTDVELAGIARRLDRLRHSKKFEFIAELRITAPAHEQTRGC